MANALTRTKSIDQLMVDSGANSESGLKRTLGPGSLVALGIGAIIGSGLFVRTAAAIAERAGPSVVIAFIFAGFGCAFAGLCWPLIRMRFDPAAEHALRRFTGWSFSLGGAAYSVTWMVAPIEMANMLTAALLGAVLLLVVVRVGWGFAHGIQQ